MQDFQERAVRRIGVLTGGGDCPGLNAVIRAVALRCEDRAVEVVGYRNGWKGMLERDSIPLTRQTVKGILHLGGTMLGTSRTDPFTTDGGLEGLRETMEVDALDGLVVIGGDGTLSASRELVEEGFRLVGVPKTIDNDLKSTDVTFGHDTAVWIATEAIDRLHSTAEAHNRVMIVEVMGRHTGWIAAHAGIAGGADVILVPERKIEFERVCERIRSRERRGRGFSIVVVAEGVNFANGSDVQRRSTVRPGQASARLAEELEARLGTEVRTVVLGHTQRGGTPTPHDRMLATRFGARAADAVVRGEWGTMVSLRGTQVLTVPLEEAVRELKTLDPDLVDLIEAFT